MATSKIQILITADDKASAKLKAIAAGLDETASKTKKANTSFGQLKTTALEATAALGVATIAVYAGKRAFDATVGAVVDYNKAISDASEASGTTVEDFSRIVQVADDFGISMGDVQTSLALATKNGFAPSVDSLADLADRLNSIKSPTERAAAAAKIFGRNWAALDPVLQAGGKAIRNTAAAIQDGLVVTQQELAQTESLRLQLDMLNDSWADLKNTIGLAVVPVLNDVAFAFNQSEKEWRIIEGLLEDGTPKVEALARAEEIMAEEARNATETARWQGLADSLGGAADGIGSAGNAAGDAAPKFKSLFDAIDPSVGSEIGQMIEDLQFKAAGGAQFQIAAQAIKDAVSAQEITEEEGMQMLGGLFAAEQNLEVQLGNITANDAAKNIASTLNISLADAKKLAEDTKKNIMDIPREIIVKISYEYSGTPPGGQHGLDMVVPPGFPNDTFPVLASSGERVVVIPQSTTNDNRTFNFNASGMGGGEDLLEKFEQRARRS